MNLTDLNSITPPGWQGKYPPCQIQVDPEGGLFHNGAPIIHPKVLQTIYAAVRLEDEVYFLELEGKRCQLEVSDTFFVVRRAQLNGGSIQLILSGGETESLDPASLWVGDGDVIYCMVRGGRFPARFLRAAYYQLARWIDEDQDGFYLSLNGRRFPIKY